MLYCQNCHREQPDGTILCDYCGADIVAREYQDAEAVAVPAGAATARAGTQPGAPIPTLTPAPATPSAPAPAQQPTPLEQPQYASQSESGQLAPTQKLRSRPAISRSQQTPTSLPNYSAFPPRQPDAAPPANGAGHASNAPRRVVLLVLEKQTIELAAPKDYRIGRHDPEQQIFPDIDLHEANGMNGAVNGVSRRHAIIHVNHNTASIEDLESRNFTILNGFRLFPYQQYPLMDGDEILLGNIRLSVKIQTSL